MLESSLPKSLLTLNRSDVLVLRPGYQDRFPNKHFVVNGNELIITKCSFDEKLDSETLSNKNQKITFNGCIFRKGVNFNDHVNLEFSDCQFLSDCIFAGSKNFFTIKKSKFTGTVNISGPIKHGNFVIEECELTDVLCLEIHPNQSAYLTRITSSAKIIINKTHVKRNLELTQISATAIEFDLNVLINGELHLSHIEVIELLFDELTVNDRIMIINLSTAIFKILNIKSPILFCSSLKCSDKTDIYTENIKELHFEDIQSSHLYLSRFIAKEAHFKFINLECEKLEFDNLKNEGSLELNQVAVKNSFYLLFSDLKKTDFIHCKMNDAKWVFKNSKISELFLAGTSFPKRVYNENEKQDEEQARLAYGQLHKAMLNMGDSVNALHYQSSEIAAHFRQLKWNLSFKESFTKFNLFLNWLSNDFGRSWSRGVVFSFGIAILFFYLLTISTNEYSFGWFFDCDQNLLGSFFRFINPLRFYETEKIFESAGALKLTPGSYVIDFIARVLIAYGFYQTIQAFRRLGKS